MQELYFHIIIGANLENIIQCNMSLKMNMHINLKSFSKYKYAKSQDDVSRFFHFLAWVFSIQF